MRRIPYYRLPRNTQRHRKPDAQKETVIQLEEPVKPVVEIRKEGSDTVLPHYILLLLTLVFMKNRGHHSKTQQHDGTLRGNRSFVQSIANHPKLIDMLNDICPYLRENEQIPIHTMVGLLKTLDTVRTLQSRTYRIQEVASQPSLNLRERQLGMIRAMKQYIEPERKEKLERLEKFLSMTDQMKNSANRIRALRFSKEQNNASDHMVEMLNILTPLLPEQQQKNLEKISKILKVIEIMDSNEGSAQLESQKASEDAENRIPILPEKDPSNGTEEIAPPGESDHNGGLSKAQQEKIINALKPLLSDEQQKSMDKLFEMAQGLAKQINNN
ncbi:MAG: hypothetical protein ACOX6S_02685 [Clostridia bacterium]|jgi:uncharacterized protein YoaH (UPF0181 family)